MVSLVMETDRSGQLYCRLKAKAAERVGMELVKSEISKTDEKGLGELIQAYNADAKVDGVMIQRPGESWRRWRRWGWERFERWWQELVNQIEPGKDIDGLGQESPFVPAAVKAVLTIMEAVKAEGKVVIVGSKGMVGRGLMELLAGKAEVRGVDWQEKDLGKVTRTAEVLISATGKPSLIKAGMVKPGAVVIDVGSPKGDVDFDQVKARARAITPVPGGVGPLTVACLLENLLEAVYSKG